MELQTANVSCDQLLDALEVAEVDDGRPQADSVAADDLLRELLGLVGLARAGRAVEDELPLQLEHVDCVDPSVGPTGSPRASERGSVEVEIVAWPVE